MFFVRRPPVSQLATLVQFLLGHAGPSFHNVLWLHQKDDTKPSTLSVGVPARRPILGGLDDGSSAESTIIKKPDATWHCVCTTIPEPRLAQIHRYEGAAWSKRQHPLILSLTYLLFVIETAMLWVRYLCPPLDTTVLIPTKVSTGACTDRYPHGIGRSGAYSAPG